MAILIVEHNVQDFNTWNAVFTGHEGTRAKYGIGISHVYRGASDPNMVCVISEAESTDAIQAFLASEELQHAMESAGVMGEPKMQVLEAPITA